MHLKGICSSHYFAFICVSHAQPFRICIMHVLKYLSGIQCGSKAAISPVQTCFLKGDPNRSSFVWKGNADVVWTAEGLNSYTFTSVNNPLFKNLAAPRGPRWNKVLMRQMLTKSSFKSYWGGKKNRLVLIYIYPALDQRLFGLFSILS